jgi:protein gp37
MSAQSSIEWTDSTWNPVRGCSKISPGCKHCYAERFAERFRGVAGHPYEQGFDFRLAPERLADPLRWSDERMIFVNSMSDLFHEEVPDAYIQQVCEVMAHARWHIFQILTKRSDRLLSLLSGRLRGYCDMPHIWWGVSVENVKYGMPRISQLQRAPAKMRFLSIEPLLEDLGVIDLSGICWVIVGGESGPGARQLDSKWVRSIRDQCAKAKVPFFFKQWGGVRKKERGRKLDGKTYDAFPAVRRGSVLSTDKRKLLAAQYSVRQLVSIRQ